MAGTDVLIIFNAAIVATVKGTDVNSNGTFTGSFAVPPTTPSKGSPYTVTAQQGQGEFVIKTASAFLSVPCPSLTLNPSCGKLRDLIAVHGAGFRQDIVVTLTFTPPAGTPPFATVTPGLDSTFDVSFNVPTNSPGTYTVDAIQSQMQLAARAVFTLPCAKGQIKLLPEVGPPGTVVTVTGTGFPVGAVIKLSWNQGIPLALPSITIPASQGFQLTILIFPHDQLGKRTMNAGPDLSVAGAPLFNIATADFLVVQGTAQPKKFSWRR